MAETRSRPSGAAAREAEEHAPGSARTGEATAAALYERHLEEVFRYVLRRVPNEARAAFEETVREEIYANGDRRQAEAALRALR